MQVVSMVCALVEKSLQTALYYTEKANRNHMTETDLMYALKYETSIFLDSTDADDRIRELYTEVRTLKTDTDSSSDSESDSVSSSETIESEIEEFTEAKNESDEKICRINYVNLNWETFQPTDIIKKLLKESIDNTIQRIEKEGIHSVHFEINV